MNLNNNSSRPKPPQYLTYSATIVTVQTTSGSFVYTQTHTMPQPSIPRQIFSIVSHGRLPTQRRLMPIHSRLSAQPATPSIYTNVEAQYGAALTRKLQRANASSNLAGHGGGRSTVLVWLVWKERLD